jgi:long-chain acyl-CoA synthetase
VAGGLRECGIAPGDAVALNLANSLWFIVAYYGALFAGAVAVPVNPAQPEAALRRQLEEVGAKTVITASGAAGLLSKPIRGYRPSPEDLAQLQLTGGTTGRSKAVRVLHRNLVANALQVACFRSHSLPEVDSGGLRLRPVPAAANRCSIVPGEAVSVAVAPLFHGLGLVGYNINVLYGATVVVSRRFDPAALLAGVERDRVSHLSGSPAMYHALLRCPAMGAHDLSSVRLLTSGAAPIEATALDRLRQCFPNASVGEGYGLTEATMGVTSSPPGVASPAGSVGLPYFDTTIEIREPDGATVLPAGQTGEVWVRGPQVTDGYHEAPELTALQFRDGWLATGDVGRLDTQGFLYLAGRSKDMIIYKGYNVYPLPLEEILCSHPAIAQAAVVGAPSTETGEVPVAFVVPRPGMDISDVPGAEVLAYVAARVAPYQRIRALHVVEALPLTPTGKVLKSDLRERASRQ